jgi:tetratricopeptide (TPR) repeat protein
MSDRLQKVHAFGQRIIRAGSAVFAVTLFLAGVAVGDPAAAGFGGLGAAAWAYWWVSQQRWRRLAFALQWGDVADAQGRFERLWAKLDENARQHPRVQVFRALVLATDCQWREVLQIVENLARYKAMPDIELHRRGLEIRCLAGLGRGEEAIALARDWLSLSPPKALVPFYSLGIAQLHTRRCEGALASFAEVEQRARHDGLRASCAFYRAEALRSLGREAEARAAYELAAQRAPRSLSGQLARKRLDAPPPSTYR